LRKQRLRGLCNGAFFSFDQVFRASSVYTLLKVDKRKNVRSRRKKVDPGKKCFLTHRCLIIKHMTAQWQAFRFRFRPCGHSLKMKHHSLSFLPEHVTHELVTLSGIPCNGYSREHCCALNLCVCLSWSSYDRTWFSGPDKQEILILILMCACPAFTMLLKLHTEIGQYCIIPCKL
jgi:hypothetical protein